ncbi:MAG TPA: tellurium resistance protein, partial [Paracoccus sp. (in: a-proteobacteria)]|nr:tellurium resistance protein [Paracoccus sp. (in: a-proteobacteria)]
GWTGAGQVFAWMALAGLAVLAVMGRWLLQDGFSPLWGALTFPVAATAGVWVALWHAAPSEPARLIAGTLLAGTTLVVIPVLALVLRDWARGRLPVKTNAAIA